MMKNWTSVDCMECGKTFKKRDSEIKRTKRHYCSIKCRDNYNKHSSPKKKSIDFTITKNGCYECLSHKVGKRGYPRIHKKLVFRHVYEQMYGEIPKESVVRHTCDNKLCINPEHLILGTQLDNIKDMIERNRMPRGSNRPNAKITEKEAAEIKLMLLKTDLTQKEIAKNFGVSYCIVKQIKQGRTWRHVEVSS